VARYCGIPPSGESAKAILSARQANAERGADKKETQSAGGMTYPVRTGGRSVEAEIQAVRPGGGPEAEVPGDRKTQELSIVLCMLADRNVMI